MSKAPKVILFEPEERDAAPVQHIFQRHEYDLQTVKSLGEIQIPHGADTLPVDCVMMPLRLRDGASGVSACLQVKSTHALASVPIIGLSATQDKAIMQAFYEMGADSVFAAPFDADLVYYQTGALVRQRRLFRELLSEAAPGGEAKVDDPLALLDFSRDAFVVLTPEGRISFLNAAALILTGLEKQTACGDGELGAFFSRLIAENAPELNQPHFPSEVPTCIAHSFSFPRKDGITFEGTVELQDVRGSRNELVCYLARLEDPAQLRRLAGNLLQSQRVRSLSLLSAAAVLGILHECSHPGAATPLATIDRIFGGQLSSASLEQTVTHLLEFLDLAISPEIAVKVNIRNNLELAVRPADLIQLLGHMILYSAEFVGSRGEILISSSDNIAGEGVSLVISATAVRHASHLRDIRVTELLAGDFSRFLDPESPSNRLDYGLEAAQKLALKYRSQVEFRNPSEDLLKLRVKLPPLRRN